MKYIEFGKNHVNLSSIILGMMRISSLSAKEVERLIDTALDSGINAFDLADCYADGLCERIVGKVLASRPDLRDRMWIQSKCGIRRDNGLKYFDFSGEHITEAIDGILTRLNIDHIDSLLLHRPDALMEPYEINEAIGNVRCVSSGGAIRAYPIASNEEVAKPIFLAGQGGDTVNVTFIDDNGKEQTITVSCIGGYFDRLNEATWPLTHKRYEEFGYATMLDDHCGYICIPRESYDAVLDCSASLNDDYPEVRELLISRIEGLKAQGMERLVIDLRDNDGGLDCINEEVAALFADRETKIYAGFYDDASGKFVKSKYWEWKVNHDGRYSDIPVVVLVNAGCASSGDVLAYHLSQYPNVTMMGLTTTWGSGQAMGGECLMSGGHIAVRYPVIATLDSDCNVLIDAGADRVTSIPLDVKIPLDYAAVTAMYERGEDYELAYAVDYLNVNGVAS